MQNCLISKGILAPIIALAETQTDVSPLTQMFLKQLDKQSLYFIIQGEYLKNTAWAISNICRVPHNAHVANAAYPCLPALIRIIQKGIEDLDLLCKLFRTVL